jgi:hypothetical protein
MEEITHYVEASGKFKLNLLLHHWKGSCMTVKKKTLPSTLSTIPGTADWISVVSSPVSYSGDPMFKRRPESWELLSSCDHF